MTLYVQSQGKGPELVFIHGWGMNGDIWEDLMPALIPHYRVSIVDLPGHGRSIENLKDYTLPSLADELHQLIPGKANVVGWSLGGQIALQLALDYPDLVNKLVIVASAPRFVKTTDWPDGVDREVLENFAGDLRTDFKKTVKRFIAIQASGDENAKDIQRKLLERVFRHGDPQIAALEAGLEILQTTDLRPRLSELSCPVLLVSGEHDTLFRPAAADQTRALIAGAQLKVIKGAGHAPFISHSPEFLDSLCNFLDGRLR